MRHRFHSICPYFAMFPEAFAEKHLCLADSDAVVLDPFSGRGTTVFQALLGGRKGIGIDVNPVAVCVSRAKADPPSPIEIRARIDELEACYTPMVDDVSSDEFFQHCFHETTLSQVLWLRQSLDWRNNKVDCFIAAMAAGCLHGESHRSARVFSNRMPRTISTKPAYSVRWWQQGNHVAPQRDVFNILREEADYRFASTPPSAVGIVCEGDVRTAADLLPDWHGTVSSVITSPPYLDVTHFREDQWLRVWFLGGDSRPCSATEGDDRHSNEESYWDFLEASWRGIAPLLKSNTRFVVRIGGKKMTAESAKEGLTRTLSNAMGSVECKDVVTSEIQRGQLRAFRPNAAGIRREFDLVFAIQN